MLKPCPLIVAIFGGRIYREVMKVTQVCKDGSWCSKKSVFLEEALESLLSLHHVKVIERNLSVNQKENSHQKLDPAGP